MSARPSGLGRHAERVCRTGHGVALPAKCVGGLRGTGRTPPDSRRKRLILGTPAPRIRPASLSGSTRRRISQTTFSCSHLNPSALPLPTNAFTTTYHQREHSEIGVPPQAAWVGACWLPRMPRASNNSTCCWSPSPKRGSCTVHGIHFQGLRYLHPTLAAYVREPVTIRYDPPRLPQDALTAQTDPLPRLISTSKACSGQDRRGDRQSTSHPPGRLIPRAKSATRTATLCRSCPA